MAFALADDPSLLEPRFVFLDQTQSSRSRQIRIGSHEEVGEQGTNSEEMTRSSRLTEMQMMRRLKL